MTNRYHADYETCKCGQPVSWEYYGADLSPRPTTKCEACWKTYRATREANRIAKAKALRARLDAAGAR